MFNLSEYSWSCAAALLTALAFATPATGQGFDQLDWTLGGNVGGAGSLTNDVMHLESSSEGICENPFASGTGYDKKFYSAVAPYDAVVSAHLVFDNQDTCSSFWHVEQPIYLINGVSSIILCDSACFDFEADFSFEVKAGDEFALGVNSVDCACEPGVADYTNFEFTFAPEFDWQLTGNELAGTNGQAPVLQGAGELAADTPFRIAMKKALPNAPAYVIASLTAINAPFKGGVLVPSPTPPSVLVAGMTNAVGRLTLDGVWPAGVPADLPLHVQTWVQDPTGPAGFSASNALLAPTQ
ncbi:MAG: hypothetical protein DHS20C15_30810 [Planctomycetota bacterium]|nr:MAG: hypothetical protein DHS20C15_30810 [Planctomycetota bacterium]